MSVSLFNFVYFEKPIVVLFVFKGYIILSALLFINCAIKSMIFFCFARGPGFNPQRRHFFSFFLVSF